MRRSVWLLASESRSSPAGDRWHLPQEVAVAEQAAGSRGREVVDRLDSQRLSRIVATGVLVRKL